jgi:hypothetical protein
MFKETKFLIFSLSKTDAVIETIIATEGHELNVPAPYCFSVLGDTLSLFHSISFKT